MFKQFDRSRGILKSLRDLYVALWRRAFVRASIPAIVSS